MPEDAKQFRTTEQQLIDDAVLDTIFLPIEVKIASDWLDVFDHAYFLARSPKAPAAGSLRGLSKEDRADECKHLC